MHFKIEETYTHMFQNTILIYNLMLRDVPIMKGLIHPSPSSTSTLPATDQVSQASIIASIIYIGPIKMLMWLLIKKEKED
jgi:hypothetical protein